MVTTLCPCVFGSRGSCRAGPREQAVTPSSSCSPRPNGLRARWRGHGSMSICVCLGRAARAGQALLRAGGHGELVVFTSALRPLRAKGAVMALCPCAWVARLLPGSYATPVWSMCWCSACAEWPLLVTGEAPPYARLRAHVPLMRMLVVVVVVVVVVVDVVVWHGVVQFACVHGAKGNPQPQTQSPDMQRLCPTLSLRTPCADPVSCALAPAAQARTPLAFASGSTQLARRSVRPPVPAHDQH